MNSAWALGWKTLWRDLRAGELRLLIVAVTLAVAALTAVGFFADRLKGGLQRDARQLLGGDAVVRSDGRRPPPSSKAQGAGPAKVTSMVTFPSMGRAPDAQGGASGWWPSRPCPRAIPCAATCRWPPARQPGAHARRARARRSLGRCRLLEALGLKLGDPLLLGDAPAARSRVITWSRTAAPASSTSRRA
jgi:putative ABC transport system permease protein